MNSSLEVIFGLLGGLAVFIFGMNMMSDCLLISQDVSCLFGL